MSRGFVKEDDQEETPVIPPRAALPPGVTNYVTPEGMRLLLEEKEISEKEIRDLSITDEQANRRAVNIITAKLNQLQERIVSARILDPKEQPKDEDRFGAIVTYQFLQSSKRHTFQIVGVDEADVQNGKIAFVAPIARAITGKSEGEEIDFKLGNETRKLKILEIGY